MATAGMSPRALAQSRRLDVIDDPERKDVTTMKVYDPRLNNKLIETQVSRTPQDRTRIKRALMGKYRIPQQNVFTNPPTTE